MAEGLTQCLKEESSESCESNRLCEWSSRVDRCYFDEYFTLYGIKEFGAKWAQVIEQSIDSDYSALQSADNFTWQSILDYKPSIKCPPGIEQLVYDSVVAYLTGFWGPWFYCRGKYEIDVSACNADPLCVRTSKYDVCHADQDITSPAATLSASKVLTDSLTDGTDKRILETVNKCDSITEQRECKGKCIWDTTSRSYNCLTRYDYVAALLAEPGKNSTDALCTFFAVDGFSDCYNQFTKTDCQKDEFCRSIADNRCWPKEEFYLSAAADEDPKLKQKYKRFKKQCWSHTAKEACVM